MHYCKLELNDDESLFLVHQGLVLKWASLSQQIESSTDLDSVKYFCHLLIRTIEMLQEMEEEIPNALL